MKRFKQVVVRYRVWQDPALFSFGGPYFTLYANNQVKQNENSYQDKPGFFTYFKYSQYLDAEMKIFFEYCNWQKMRQNKILLHILL